MPSFCVLRVCVPFMGLLLWLFQSELAVLSLDRPTGYPTRKVPFILRHFWLKRIICYGMLTSDTLDSTNPYITVYFIYLVNERLWLLVDL